MISKAKYTAELIKTYRQQKRYSQRELSSLLNFNNKQGQFISNVESGKCQLPTDKIILLHKALGIPVEQIVKNMVLDFEFNTYKRIKEVQDDSVRGGSDDIGAM